MEDLVVDPEHLMKWASTRDQAADKQESAATSAADIGTAVWVSHGLICGPSNVAVTKAEAARRAAGQAMKKASTGLAEKLRVASTIYQGMDLQASTDIESAEPE